MIWMPHNSNLTASNQRGEKHHEGVSVSFTKLHTADKAWLSGLQSFDAYTVPWTFFFLLLPCTVQSANLRNLLVNK